MNAPQWQLDKANPATARRICASALTALACVGRATTAQALPITQIAKSDPFENLPIPLFIGIGVGILVVAIILKVVASKNQGGPGSGGRSAGGNTPTSRDPETRGPGGRHAR